MFLRLIPYLGSLLRYSRTTGGIERSRGKPEKHLTSIKARRDDLRNIWRELSENGSASSRPLFEEDVALTRRLIAL